MRVVAQVAVSGVLTFGAGALVGQWTGRLLHPEPVSRLSEVDMWRKAVLAPLPAYPEGALKRGIGGVVVARLRVAREGRVLGVRILEASDEILARAVRASVIDWRFGAADGRFEGNATFYFKLTDGTGEVAVPGHDKAREPGGAARTTVGGWALPASATFMSEDEYNRVKDEPGTRVIDVRQPEVFRQHHREGAVNVPLDTLTEQAPLLRASLVVLDCREDRSDGCPLAAWTLARAGVPRVGVVGR
jgi:TonB family protein